MNQADKEMLEDEVALGKAAEHAYTAFIGKFIEEKRIVLFEAFQATPAVQKDDLMEIKRMATTINALDTEIKTIIETGRMATTTLNEETE